MYSTRQETEEELEIIRGKIRAIAAISSGYTDPHDISGAGHDMNHFLDLEAQLMEDLDYLIPPF